MAKNTVDAIGKLQESARDNKRLNDFLDVFEDLDQVGFVQYILGRLAGGIGHHRVRFSYSVSSPYLDNIIYRTNGIKYEVEDPEIEKSLSYQMQHQIFPRVTGVKFKYSPCEEDIIYAEFKLNYTPENRKNIFSKLRLMDYSFGKDDLVSKHEVSLDDMLYDDESGEYVARIQLENAISKTNSYNIFFELVNERDFRLSRELKIYLKKIDSLLSLDRINPLELIKSSDREKHDEIIIRGLPETQN